MFNNTKSKKKLSIVMVMALLLSICAIIPGQAKADSFNLENGNFIMKPRLGVVKKITVSKITSKSFVIKWGKVKKAKKYRILYKEGYDNDYGNTNNINWKKKTVKKRRIKFNNLKALNTYTVLIRALDGKEKKYNELSSSDREKYYYSKRQYITLKKKGTKKCNGIPNLKKVKPGYKYIWKDPLGSGRREVVFVKSVEREEGEVNISGNYKKRGYSNYYFVGIDAKGNVRYKWAKYTNFKGADIYDIHRYGTDVYYISTKVKGAIVKWAIDGTDPGKVSSNVYDAKGEYYSMKRVYRKGNSFYHVDEEYPGQPTMIKGVVKYKKRFKVFKEWDGDGIGDGSFQGVYIKPDGKMVALAQKFETKNVRLSGVKWFKAYKKGKLIGEHFRLYITRK